MTSLRCPNCGTPRHDPPDADVLPYGTVVYLTCSWCGDRYGARVIRRRSIRDDVPPGMIACAQLVGGGTVDVVGNLRGNTAIATQAQAAAASRVPGGGSLSVNIESSKRERDQIQKRIRRERGNRR